MIVAEPDVLIDALLLTRNREHFERVPGLALGSLPGR